MEKWPALLLRLAGPANQICFHCQQLDGSFSELTEPVKYLADFYLETRYPGDVPEFSLQQAKEAFENASRIKDFILDKLKEKK